MEPCHESLPGRLPEPYTRPTIPDGAITRGTCEGYVMITVCISDHQGSRVRVSIVFLFPGKGCR